MTAVAVAVATGGLAIREHYKRFEGPTWSTHLDPHHNLASWRQQFRTFADLGALSVVIESWAGYNASKEKAATISASDLAEMLGTILLYHRDNTALLIAQMKAPSMDLHFVDAQLAWANQFAVRLEQAFNQNKQIGFAESGSGEDKIRAAGEAQRYLMQEIRHAVEQYPCRAHPTRRELPGASTDSH